MESVSVAPSGNLYPCVQFVHDDRDPSQLLGDVFEGFDQEKRSRFVAAAGEGSASCRGCALNGRCNNRCACLNIQTTGRPNQVSPILCEYERLVTPIADRLASRLFRERAPGFMNKHYNCLYPYLALLDGVALQKEAVDEAI
jgi:uncharacterized protein